jgi:three-Cys-motif partner protein
MMQDNIKPNAIYSFGLQGQGPQTTAKQYALEKVLGQWLGIINRIKIKAQNSTIKYSQPLREIALRPPIYVDMNAGSGWNEKVNCIGSPLLFMSEASKYEFDIDANFIECDANKTTLLYHRLKEAFPCKKYNVRTGNNQEILPNIIKEGEKRYGLVYCDPNGPKNLQLDNLELISKHQKFRFVDLLIRISGKDYKRVRNGVDKFGEKRGYPHLIGKYQNLKIAISGIKKTKWFIREIQEPDPHEWTFLFGTNWPEYKAMAGAGFYDIKSARGAKIFDQVAFTIQEQRRL